MKRTFLLSILAVIPAALLPLAATCQVAPAAAPAERGEVSYKYEVFAGYGYTSLNQVNQSRYGLMGEKVAVNRNFGKHFAVTATGSYYKYPTGKGGCGNPGNPSVYSGLAGPEFRANLYGRFDGMFHGLLGIEHTGGEGMTPTISFAGGFGGGIIYNLSQRFALRASGDRIGASFSLNNNTPALGYSPHLHWNARGEFGVIYRF